MDDAKPIEPAEKGGNDSVPPYTGLRERYFEWLTEEGAGATSIPVLLDSFARFLNAELYEIRRCNLATDTVHPQMTGLRHVWFSQSTDPGPINSKVVVARRQYQIGEAMIDEIFFNADSQDSPQYRASPFFKVEKLGELYELVRPGGQAQPYPLFDDLVAQGCTAYFGRRLSSFAGMLQKIGIVTAAPGGLTKIQIDDLRWMLGLLTLHLNTLIEFSIKNTLARSYIGRDPGQRVCDGMIALGRVVELDAAIWFSDLRGFTSISDGLSAEALVQHLNAYFDQVVGPIYEHGGEVLKYIGDAILAIFPVSNFRSAGDACDAALATAAAARLGLEAMNAERSLQGLARLHHGVALHFGTAQYGNIGSLERLDFTIIGREVNIASRVEGLTKEYGEPLLMTEPFAKLCSAKTRTIGCVPLKGVAEPMNVCAPGD